MEVNIHYEKNAYFSAVGKIQTIEAKMLMSINGRLAKQLHALITKYYTAMKMNEPQSHR